MVLSRDEQAMIYQMLQITREVATHLEIKNDQRVHALNKPISIILGYINFPFDIDLSHKTIKHSVNFILTNSYTTPNVTKPQGH